LLPSSVVKIPIFRLYHTLVWALIVTGILGACSINEFGLVSTKHIQGDGALIHAISAPGIHIDTRDAQPSISLGYYKATHIFPLSYGDISDTSVFTNAELFRALRPQLSISRIVGGQIKSGQGETSLTLGMREHAVLISLDRSQQNCRILSYRPEDLEKTYLRVTKNDDCLKK
jgi:hypothetical protein